MNMNDMILVSVDDHLIEPPDMFKRHTPARFKGRMPRMVRTRDNYDLWLYEDRVIPNGALNSVAGRPPEEYGMEPQSLTQVRRGCFDVNARVDDMNANGQLAGLNFPTFVGFSGLPIAQSTDKALALAVIQSWNDWHIEDWCGAHPGRFVPLAIAPLWDPQLAADEVRRVKKKGCNVLSFIPNPARAGFPSIHTEHWDPLFKACRDEGVTICLHIADTTGVATSEDSPVDVWLTNFPVSLFQVASDITYSPVLRKFPGIRFMLSEGGCGWVPHCLERMDFVYRHHRAWTNQDFGDKLPSEVFLEHVYTCFIDDKAAIRERHQAGINNMTWECDYPHSDTTWPRAPEILWEGFGGVPREDIDRITHLNAMKAFNFDPFRHIPREQATVGALRAKAGHVDVGYIYSKAAQARPKRTGPMTVAERNTLYRAWSLEELDPSQLEPVESL